MLYLKLTIKIKAQLKLFIACPVNILTPMSAQVIDKAMSEDPHALNSLNGGQ